MGVWGSRWLEVAPQHLDSHLVLWNLCKLADREDLPCRRLVIRFEIGDCRQRRFWVVVQRPASEVCVKPPGFDEDLVNVNGGAVALGHPIGASGARLVLTLAHEMRRRGVDLGAAAICGGGGQGEALVIRRLDR